jgi:hypothetical protein
LRGKAAMHLQQGRRFAAEIWDVDGATSLPWDYDNAASQLKFGACEDDAPPKFSNRAAARPPQKMILSSIILSSIPS